MATKRIVEQFDVIAIAGVETLVLAFVSSAEEKRTIKRISIINATANVDFVLYVQRERRINIPDNTPQLVLLWLDIDIPFGVGERCDIGFVNGTGGNITIPVILEEEIEYT